MNIPNIDDLIRSEIQALKENEELLKVSGKESWYYLQINSSIKISKKILANHKVRVRDQKLDQLGI